MKAYPDHPDAWYRSWEHVWYALFHHVPNVPITDHDGNPRIQEYMTLLPGAATVVLALGGALEVFRGRARTAVPWLGVGAVFFWLSFGLHAPVDGFEFLRRLPLFASMRGPLRYLNFPVLLTLCLLAGVGFQAAWAALQVKSEFSLTLYTEQVRTPTCASTVWGINEMKRHGKFHYSLNL